jgi:acyl transferase domain-containing protein/NAD(P)-dependent dehydrogenase (short-subunit alcohol dehydrogenase family)
MADVVSSAVPPEPLAVIGLSCLFPKAADPGEFWSNIRRGVDAITEVPPSHWNPDAYFDADPKSPDRTYARRGGFLSPVEFDPLEFGIAPSNLEAIDTSQLLGLVGAKRALEDAGYGADRQFDRSRVGCILGVTGTLEMVIPLGARLGHPKWRQALKEAGVADDVAEDVIQRISDSYVSWQENSFPGLLGNVVAGRIANRLDLGGTNCVVDAACASSLSAIHLAALELWSGRSNMVVTGGIDTFNDIFMFMCFSKTPALSPTGDAKPFSESGDGTILGEGVGIIVLKRLGDAQRDGDKIYALIRGIGTSSDGAGNAVYAPKKEGQIRCLKNAYQIAGVSPETVELIEAHGTGTKVGDATELSGLTEVFQATGKSGRWCAIGSVKSQIGHTKAAAGAAGVLKAILALRHRVLPPTIKVDRPLAGLLDSDSPLYANTQARPWFPPKDHPRRAGVSAFGFGGSNFHCVLEESSTSVSEIDWDGDVFFAAWSADSREELSAQLADWNEVVDPIEIRRRAFQTRRQFQPAHEHRLAIIADARSADVPHLVALARRNLTTYADRTAWSTPDGIFYGKGGRLGKLGLLFPGQGSQYVNMQRELACRFPMLQNVLAEANEVFESYSPTPRPHRLSDYIYPIPAFDDDARESQEEALRDTEIAQPALGAVSLGVLAVLAEFGVRPDVVAGHSYGELTALCVSKRFAPDALYRLSMLRGRLMAEAQEVEGGMLAVGAPLSQVEAALKEAAVDLVIANRNSPTQVVLSGRLAELDRAHDELTRKNIRGKRLPVAAAFHSPLVASASSRFRPVLDDIEFRTPEIPVFGNTLAEEYPLDADEARALLAGQLAQPVEFVRQIENMAAAGVKTFLEVGPGAVLTGLVNSILSGRDVRAIAVDSSAGKRSGMLDLALSLGQLAVAGHPVQLAAWDPIPNVSLDFPANTAARLTIPICGANYVKPRAPRPPRKTTLPEPKSEKKRKEEDQREKLEGGGRPQSSSARMIPKTPSLPDAQPSHLHSQSALLVLQQMFEQTARLHRQFLDGQEQALKALERFAGGTPVAAPPMESPVPNTEHFVPRTESPVQDPDSVPERTSADIERPSGKNKTTPINSPSFPPFAPQSSTLDSQPTDSRLTRDVLAVVAEKTGYPVEMLKSEMSLDHDLGIDSIKRVEILSALQERRPDLPAVKPEQLGTLHRLDDVIALLQQGQETEAEPAIGSASQLTKPSCPPATSPRLTIGCPRSIPLSESGRKLEFAPGATFLITEDGSQLPFQVAERLTALGFQARLVPFDEPFLRRLPDDVAGLILVSPQRGITDQQLWRAVEWIQKCGPALRHSAQRHAAVFATISRLDGEFGLGSGAAIHDPLSGALSGLAKTVRHEWPEIHSTALDVSPHVAGNRDLVLQLVDRLLSAGPAEIGVSSSGWREIEVRDLPSFTSATSPIHPGELVVVTGGARGVTAACALAVAKAWRPRLVLLGRTPLSPAEPVWLSGLESPAQIKQALAQRGEPGTPLRQFDHQCRQILANREVRATMQTIRNAGADVEYLVADVRDLASVQPTLRDIQQKYGPIRGVIHGAGVLEDRRIEDKTREQFDHVFSTKIAGLRNVLSSLAADKLKFLAVFSSYTARFGRTGQVDYAMANEALNKLACQFRHQHPQCRTRSFNWGPWDGGMVTDSLRPLFEKEGVGLIPLDAGANLFVRELERTDALDNVEVVVLAERLEGKRAKAEGGRESGEPHPSRLATLHFQLANEVLAVVAEKTGYPVEMLKPEMSLDHDLGIDSIKRVEILSALQERRPDLPAVKPEQLGTLHRLQDVIALLGEGHDASGKKREEDGSLNAEGRRPENRPRDLLPSTPPPSTRSPQQPSGRCGWERTIDLAGHPYLESHVIGGKAVLPTAMIVECLAHAALHHHPGLEFIGASKLHVFKGVRIGRQESINLRVLTDKAAREAGSFVVPSRLVSTDADRDVVHAEAAILLSAQRPPSPVSRLLPMISSDNLTPPTQWYGSLLFHGPQLHGLKRIELLSRHGIVVEAKGASAPPHWIADLWRSSWLADPLAIDVALQAIIVWTQVVCERASLPTGIGEYRQFRRHFPRDGLRIVVQAQRRHEASVVANAELLDAAGGVVAELSGIEYVMDAQLSAAFQRNRCE